MKWTEEGGARRRRSRWLAVTSYAGLTTFLVVFLLLGMFGHSDFVKKKKKPRFDFPDFDRIQTFSRVLSEQDVNLKSTHNRVIFIGDVHGMNESLHDLLEHLSYKPIQDTIVFAGDLLAKSTHASSLSVIDFLTHNHTVSGKERIFPVRGNHDQLVVQWRAWREWFQTLKVSNPSSGNGLRGAVARALSLPDSISQFLRMASVDVEKIPVVSNGLEFLHLLEAEWAIARLERDADPEEYVEVARKRAIGTWREEWWKRIPEPGKGKLKQQWRLFGDHYWLARDMAEEHASYLNSLPVVLHIPQLHLFVAHAGLLPSDPKLDPTDPKQPLAHAPVLALRDSDSDSPLRSSQSGQEPIGSPVTMSIDGSASVRPSTNESVLRMAQETALLTDVPSNRDAWSVQNMRSVRKSGKVSRISDKGTPWSKIWNKEMKRCVGFDADITSDEEEDTAKKHKDKDDYDLPCRPASVVYGHAATRGLDIKRWSMGLDTGCLYGRRLTALVLKSSTSDKHDEEEGDDSKEEEDDDEDDEADDDLLEWTGQFDDEGDELDLRPRRITFGDKSMHIDARLESIKCPLIDFNNP